MSGQILAVQASYGAQPVAGSVTGSPFTIGAAGTAVTPELRTRAVMVYALVAMNVRFNPPGSANTAAAATDMLIAGGVNHVFAVVAGTKLQMFSTPGTTVHVAECREVGG